MDYEKKYKEALKRAKKLYEQGTITESLSYVFPEFKESEDGKIKRKIIKLVKMSNKVGFALHKWEADEMIAWLEKQGEQILANSAKTCKDEQKPAAWSEEDEMIALSIEQVMNCASLLNIVPEKIDKIRTWLKSLKDRYTWKPSEEEMRALNYVVNLMASSERPTENDYYYSVFKDLRKQLKKL